MNYTQKALSILAGVVVLLVLFWLFVYGPASSKLARLQEEARDIQKELSEVNDKKAGLPGVRDKITIAREKLERLEVQYPRSIELVYQAITRAAGEAGFMISKRVTGEKPVEEEGTALREYEIKITGYCSYPTLGEFLDRVTHFPMIISISELTVTKSTGSLSRSGKPDNLRVELYLTTYLSKENGQ